VIVSSTKSGAMRSFFETVISHRSGWIVRDRNRLIRRWGNMFYSNLLGSGCLPFLKSIVYMVIIFSQTADLMINRNLS
jgi:hypothetical protein